MAQSAPLLPALPGLWRTHRGAGPEGELTLHVTGTLGTTAEQVLARDLARVAGAPLDRLAEILAGLDGHFAFLAEAGSVRLAAVDCVRTTPILFERAPPHRLAADGRALEAILGLGPADVDPAAARMLAMAGYTIGDDTLYRAVGQLRPGECLRIRDGHLERRRWGTYTPWRAPSEGDGARLERELAELWLDMMRELVKEAVGRPIVVPLSAGRDSRAIAAALARVGAPDVRCFSYGLPGNFEAETARRVAGQLGHDWTFVPLGARRMRRFLTGETYRRFAADVDALSAAPFVQDVPVLEVLREREWLPADAVVVNGMSGDFISGGHVPASLVGDRPATGAEAAVAALVAKHFRLWRDLAAPENDRIIAARLEAEIRDIAPDADRLPAGGLFEAAELQDRQAKYVVSGQRAYELFGLDWRLPFWAPRFVDFWARVPLAEKLGQRLYIRTLTNADWGGVWRDLPVNRRTIRPHWVKPLRWAGMALAAPFGRTTWHALDARLFAYWMEPLGTSAVEPWWRVALDRHGARHGLAWATAAYLRSKGLDHAGRPLAPRDRRSR